MFFPRGFSNKASLVAQMVKNLPAMRKTWVWSLGLEDPLEKGTTTHSSVLAWRIPGSSQDSNTETLPEFPAYRSGLKVATSTHTWISNLPADFKLTTPYKSVSQDLRLNQSLTHAHSCSLSNLWFSFSAEPWLPEQVLPMCFCPVLFSGSGSGRLLSPIVWQSLKLQAKKKKKGKLRFRWFPI